VSSGVSVALSALSLSCTGLAMAASVDKERKRARWKRALCALGAVDVVFSVCYLRVLYQAKVCVSEDYW